MNKEKDNSISTKDCSPFEELKVSELNIIHEFNKNFSTNSVFNFSTITKNEEINFNDEQFAYYNYKEKKWFAGRWVGIANFNNHTVEVKPRFSEVILLIFIEKIFSINILDSFNQEKDNITNFSSIFEKLLPFIWTKKLGEANKYGIPLHHTKKYHTGANIKGKLEIRRSILPYFKSKFVVSSNIEKEVNEPIAQIILNAKKVLENKLGINKTKNIKGKTNHQSNINLYKENESAYNAILNFEAAGFESRKISESEYLKIRYKSIYQSYKSIVDFSWQIIKLKQLTQESSDNKKGFSLFVDMAEIWELYLLRLLKDNFPEWEIESPTIQTYEGKLFNRKLIPDIVMKNGNYIMIFDAKWKKMDFDYRDIDRIDFFQIHTYASYYQNHTEYNLLAVGLLYPLSKPINSQELISDGLFDLNNQTKFIIEGIDLSEFKDDSAKENEKTSLNKEKNEKIISDFRKYENEFIERIKKLIELN